MRKTREEVLREIYNKGQKALDDLLSVKGGIADFTKMMETEQNRHLNTMEEQAEFYNKNVTEESKRHATFVDNALQGAKDGVSGIGGNLRKQILGEALSSWGVGGLLKRGTAEDADTGTIYAATDVLDIGEGKILVRDGAAKSRFDPESEQTVPIVSKKKGAKTSVCSA